MRGRVCALTIAGAYVAGGFIPLSPYIMQSNAQSALIGSVGVTLAALLLLGAIKGHFTGAQPLRSGLQTTLIGGVAAAAAYLIAKAIS